METFGVVNKIIPFSAVDGPGCRTAVFLQGCNFDCQFCHNPETISFCKECGVCIKHCPTGAIQLKESHIQYDETLCVQCDTCIRVCPNNSSPKTKHYKPKELVQVIMKNVPFIRGVTFSGGECTIQRKFLEEVIPALKKNKLNILLDSNGTFSFAEMEELINQIDGVMLDIKAFSSDEHKKITSQENSMVLNNAIKLAKLGKLTEVRTVIIPELFDAEASVRETARLLAPYLSNGNIQYKLITYRPLGVRKQYAHLNAPSKKQMKELENIVKEYGFTDTIIT